MDDAVNWVLVSDPLERLGIRKVHSLEVETVAVLLLQIVEPRLLQRRIVIIVDIIDADDIVARAQAERAKSLRQ